MHNDNDDDEVVDIVHDGDGGNGNGDGNGDGDGDGDGDGGEETMFVVTAVNLVFESRLFLDFSASSSNSSLDENVDIIIIIG